jgi:hypothetical protein
MELVNALLILAVPIGAIIWTIVGGLWACNMLEHRMERQYKYHTVFPGSKKKKITLFLLGGPLFWGYCLYAFTAAKGEIFIKLDQS